MASDKSSQAPPNFIRTGQTPIEEASDEAAGSLAGPTVVDPTLNEKSLPLSDTQLHDSAPPPAYSEGSERSISEIPAPPTPSSCPSHLRKIIAIPAIDAAFDSPFIRAYPPMLKDYKLPRESFLSFLDNLNQVIATSPPLQVLDAAGGILRSVPILFPLHWVGGIVSGLANLSSLGVSKGRVELAIRQANKEIFGPRGLKLEIAKLDALAHVAGIPILDSRGKVDKQAPILQPFAREANNEAESLDAQQRRIKALQPWLADLELDTLPWTSKSKLTRFNAALKKRAGNVYGYNHSDDRALQVQRQVLADERRRKLALAQGEYNRNLLALDNEERQARSRDGESEKLARGLSSLAKDRAKVQKRYDDDVKKINEDYTAEDREEAGIRKILWLIIRDVGADSGADPESGVSTPTV